jgi:hypothetical protein
MVLDEQQGFKRMKKQRDCRDSPRQSWKPPGRGEAIQLMVLVQVWFCVITKERSFSPPAAPWSTIEMM